MAHEDLTRDHQVDGSSDRAFGLVFAGVFLVLGCWPLLRGEAPQWWLIGVAAGCALVAMAKPALLAGLNRAWIRLGILLGRVVSPVALGLLFYGVLVPLGVLVRLSGKDPLRLKRDPGSASYWIPREPPGPPPDSMNRQF